MWNKNNQIDSVVDHPRDYIQLKSTSTELPLFSSQNNSGSTSGLNQDTLESLKIQKQAMKEKNVELSRKVESLNLDIEEFKLTVADDKRKIDLLKNECDEWRRKYKEELKVMMMMIDDKQKKQSVTIEKQVSGVTDKETIESLKQEIDYLRSKNDQMIVLLKKTGETATVPSATSTPSTEVDVNGNDILTKNVSE